MRWYMPRSKILTNKREAMKIANKVRSKGNFKRVSVAKRTIAGNKNTGTPKSNGYWVKVSKR